MQVATDLLYSADAGRTLRSLVTDGSLVGAADTQEQRFGTGSGGTGVRAVYISPANGGNVRGVAHRPGRRPDKDGAKAG